MAKKRITGLQKKRLNRSLHAAKATKQDEFYTQYTDIQKEVEAYLEYDPDKQYEAYHSQSHDPTRVPGQVRALYADRRTPPPPAPPAGQRRRIWQRSQ